MKSFLVLVGMALCHAKVVDKRKTVNLTVLCATSDRVKREAAVVLKKLPRVTVNYLNVMLPRNETCARKRRLAKDLRDMYPKVYSAFRTAFKTLYEHYQYPLESKEEYCQETNKVVGSAPLLAEGIRRAHANCVGKQKPVFRVKDKTPKVYLALKNIYRLLERIGDESERH